MKYGRFQIQLSKLNHPDWLTDSKIHTLSATEQKSTIKVTKRPGPIFDIRYKPWFGPEIDFNDVTCSDLSKSCREVTDLMIVWDSPSYSVYFDQTLVKTRPDKKLAAAAELALPYDEYTKIEKSKAGYVIKRPPEECDAWELSEIPRFITTKFGIQQGVSEFFFLHMPSNTTQKAREMVHVWQYAVAIEKLFANLPKDQHRSMALLVPKDDRGIDCYIRLLNFGPQPQFALIPIQVCECPFSTGDPADDTVPPEIRNRRVTIQEKRQTPEDVIVSIVEDAKKDAGQNGDITLLIAPSAMTTVAVDMMRLRDAFDSKGPWPYARIVCVTNLQNKSLVFTTYCKPPYDHFIIQFSESDLTWAVGRTPSDIKANEGKQSTIRF